MPDRNLTTYVVWRYRGATIAKVDVREATDEIAAALAVARHPPTEWAQDWVRGPKAFFVTEWEDPYMGGVDVLVSDPGIGSYILFR